MRFGFPEFFLLFAAVVSFHNLNTALVVAGFAALFAFCRYAFELQQKNEKVKEREDTAKLLNEQAEELGQALGKLFSNLKTDMAAEQKKYDKDKLH